MNKTIITIYQREVYVHIHTIDQVSMTTHMDRKAYQRKEPKLLPFENYKSE